MAAGGWRIGRREHGDKASFTVETFANHSFAGHVTQIRPSPQTHAQAAAYDAVIRASNADLLLTPGMRAAIRIVVDQRDDVLRAPNQALRYSPGKRVDPGGTGTSRAPPEGSPRLWILRGGKPIEIPVQPGLGDGAWTEIVKGDVQPGDELIVGESGGILEKPAAMRIEP
jgi:HlyD family secretion protein